MREEKETDRQIGQRQQETEMKTVTEKGWAYAQEKYRLLIAGENIKYTFKARIRGNVHFPMPS